MKSILVLLGSLGWMAMANAASVDINSADARTLAAELKGVGLERAEAIVQYRKDHGPFRSVEDLVKVKGVGKKTVETNRANLILGSTR